MDVLENLIKGRAVIASPIHWCQGFRHQQTKDGVDQYCAIGALLLAAGYVHINGPDLDEIVPDEIVPAVAALAATIPNERRYSVAAWSVSIHNNTNTHAEVLALFDTAITRQRHINTMLHGLKLETVG